MNKIMRLRDEDGKWWENQKYLTNVALKYFHKLFEEYVNQAHSSLSYIHPRVSDEQNRMLVTPFKMEEFTKAVHQMHLDTSPRPDGFNPAFIQRFWALIGANIFQSGTNWLNQGEFPKTLIATIIALIPKNANPIYMKDLRPIALCNVLYKIIAKVLANRLKIILPVLIDEEQSAFVPGRAITDYVLVAFEIIHRMKTRRRQRIGEVALKIDISKAYDRLRWDYLLGVMGRMGFAPKCVEWMEQCITAVTYSVSVKGELVGLINPMRGLRQGDPLFPYLFIIGAEGLSALIKQS